jgi:hypothetical protein
VQTRCQSGRCRLVQARAGRCRSGPVGAGAGAGNGNGAGRYRSVPIGAEIAERSQETLYLQFANTI